METKVVKIWVEDVPYQHLEVLKTNRTKRHKAGEFFVEGVRNINEAVKNRWEIEAFIYSREKPLSDWAYDTLENVPVGTHFELTDVLMQKLSDKENTSELIAVVSMPENDLSRIKTTQNMTVVVFDRPTNKGNLGTMLRSCDALGVQGLIVTGHGVDIYDPETIGASMGSFFKVPVVNISTFAELTGWLQKLKAQYPGLQVIGTSAHGSTDIAACDFKLPTILLIGNETEGLSRNYKEMSDKLVFIPMSPASSASSLNVACAASICLYEINRQRK
ncbi:MAG: TrmH family RNA methyltransferase [Dehalococcoidales bacterium]|nr:TrmH family RNA methyltransferase [Dehalococcoidales bacterium]